MRLIFGLIWHLGHRIKFFFCWATDWALKWYGWTGPVGPDRASLRVKKTCLLKEVGSDNRGGFRHKETRPESDPLSFLSQTRKFVISKILIIIFIIATIFLSHINVVF